VDFETLLGNPSRRPLKDGGPHRASRAPQFLDETIIDLGGVEDPDAAHVPREEYVRPRTAATVLTDRDDGRIRARR
jgi:hypothetical protein